MIILLSLLFITSNAHLKSFNPERFQMVDKSIVGNYLFRSGSLLTTHYTSINTSIAYDEIFNEIRKIPGTPSNFYILDISLLDPDVSDDLWSLTVEHEYWHTKGGGTLINWPIYGELSSPEDYPEKQREFLVQNFMLWSRDRLPTLVTFLKQTLNLVINVPVIIIVHCMNGVDRTGEVIGSYISAATSTAIATNVCSFLTNDTKMNCKPSPKLANYNALMWYKMYSDTQTQTQTQTQTLGY